jgi:hypothetical protein
MFTPTAAHAPSLPITIGPDRDLDCYCEHRAVEDPTDIGTHGPCEHCDNPAYIAYLLDLIDSGENEAPDWDTRWLDGPEVDRRPGWWLDGDGLESQWIHVGP